MNNKQMLKNVKTLKRNPLMQNMQFAKHNWDILKGQNYHLKKKAVKLWKEYIRIVYYNMMVC